MRADFIATCLLLSFCSASAAAGQSDSDRQRRVDAIFSGYSHADSPGCAVGIIHDDDFVYKRGYGMGSIELAAPLSPESVFYMGSVSKQFTAASVAQIIRSPLTTFSPALPMGFVISDS